jgi:hypothetical protein
VRSSVASFNNTVRSMARCAAMFISKNTTATGAAAAAAPPPTARSSRVHPGDGLRELTVPVLGVVALQPGWPHWTVWRPSSQMFYSQTTLVRVTQCGMFLLVT